MTVEFRMAGGSVMGREHYRLRGNRQDAFRIERRGDVSVAVICDGCGDTGSASSEVGAGLGARIIAHKLADLFTKEPCGLETAERVERTLEEVRRGVLSELRRLVKGMGEDGRQVICDCFLFTVVGCVVGQGHAAFFSIGDGVIVVNGEAKIIGPFADNAPPYLAYGLLSEFKDHRDVRFTLHRYMAVGELKSFLIGSDGVCDLMEMGGQNMPGGRDVVGEMDSFWNTNGYYENPFMLSNRLRLINSDQIKIDWEARKKVSEFGRLSDDTTLVVGSWCTR